MKARALLLPGLLLLASCASLPSPGSPSDSLVIGFFTLHFPGGYFDTQQTIIERDLELDFRDVTTGRNFSLFPVGGTFKFLAQGNDAYRLVTSRASLENGTRRYIIGPRAVGIDFQASPGKVTYVGDIQLTYSHSPGMPVLYPELDYEIRAEGEGGFLSDNGGGVVIKTVESYNVAIARKSDEKALREYMKRVAPDSPWLSRDIVDMKQGNDQPGVQPAQESSPGG